MPAYPDTNWWSTTHHIQIATVNPTARLVKGTETNKRPVRHQTVQQTVVTNANLQKQLLSEYKPNSKNKSQAYSKFL